MQGHVFSSLDILFIHKQNHKHIQPEYWVIYFESSTWVTQSLMLTAY